MVVAANNARLCRRALLIGAELAALAAVWPGRSVEAAGSSGEVMAGGTGRLNAFDLRGVRLLPSRWQSQQTEVLDYYLAVPDDRYLRGFRVRSGRSAPGTELGGWYSNDFFNPFGQIVSGLARLYAATGRAEAKAKVHALIAGFVECIAADGFFFYSKQPNARHYGYDKMLCGLLDAWQYCDDTRARDAIPTITRWAEKPENLSLARPYGWDGAEWYTLAENLFRAYLATGDARYREFAQVWEYHGFWGHFHRAEDWFTSPLGNAFTPYHAYSHVNSLNGLGAGHFAVGGDYFREALVNAYDAVRATQIYATGGYGPNELLHRDRQHLKQAIRDSRQHFETQCGSWAVFKLVKYLLRITGDGRFGDWAEQMVYNGVGASRQSTPINPNGPGGGEVQYFSDYASRGGTKLAINAWSCCSGTRPQAVADYTDLVFLHAPGELCVNLFLPATVDWPVGSGRLRARQETAFPESDNVRLTILEAPNSELTVKFRNPGWLAAAASAKVNGANVSLTPVQNWLPVRRVWRAGDVIDLTLPTGARPRLARFTATEAHPAALVQGPVVLAYGATFNPVKNSTAQAILDSLQRVPGSLGYRIGSTGPTVVRPYYGYAPGEAYFMYLDPLAPPFVNYQGKWGFGTVAYTTTAGSYADVEFDGTGIRWRWQEFDDAGIARVEIDGQQVAMVDQYGPQRGVVTRNSDFTGLAAGRHRMRISYTATKRPESKATYINVLNADYLS